MQSPGLAELSSQPVIRVFKVLRHSRKAREVERECLIRNVVSLYCTCGCVCLSYCVAHRIKCIS